jgi:predicted  nucleic acid-binding Zn-ribbon protein
MSDQILALLRRMVTKLIRVTEDATELKQRVMLLEGQCADLSRRLDRAEERLNRIERRLETA